MNILYSHKDLETIFDEGYSRFVFQALRIVKKEDVAEDIVQECFIKLWEKNKELSISGNINAYLAKMVKNKCLDFIKKKKLQISELNESYQGGFSIDDHLETADLQEKIDKTLDNLPEKCRQVFILSRFEDMSYAEIAEQLGISKKTVEAHISKALKSFRVGLKQFLVIILNINKGRNSKNRFIK